MMAEDLFGNLPPVPPERTGWRDQAISQRHRDWGFNCPAVDLDFVAAEYNLGKPVAIVEYKHWKAKTPDPMHPTYRALRDLADGYRNGGLPFWLAYYWPEFWGFRVQPMNALSERCFSHDQPFCEYDYVLRLYDLRAQVIEKDVMRRLHRQMPPERRPHDSSGNGTDADEIPDWVVH